jgi:hypothetical protein
MYGREDWDNAGLWQFSYQTGRKILKPPGALSSEFFNSKPFRHFFVQKAFSGTIRLYPLSIDYELWDGSFAGSPNYLFGSTGSVLDIDLRERKIVLLQKALGDAAVGTPRGRVDGNFH